ncbi:hypothetical protein P5G61_09920 [Paenibacillus sp. F6_3S_P_1C]|uniref:Uncharacterized protein n=1 Tax=Paenibacillus vandeheii TaxID=3035917 RepID=A0ABT8J8V3_9BACL|nr:hypothetical protein [Paenibacillus vandeheii]MDN4601540.1 hypothetical protein [Paenibacillus vandeheii]
MTEPGDSRQGPNVGFVLFYGKDEGPQIVANKRDRLSKQDGDLFHFQRDSMISFLTPRYLVSAEVHHAALAKMISRPQEDNTLQNV